MLVFIGNHPGQVYLVTNHRGFLRFSASVLAVTTASVARVIAASTGPATAEQGKNTTEQGKNFP